MCRLLVRPRARSPSPYRGCRAIDARRGLLVPLRATRRRGRSPVGSDEARFGPTFAARRDRRGGSRGRASCSSLSRVFTAGAGGGDGEPVATQAVRSLLATLGGGLPVRRSLKVRDLVPVATRAGLLDRPGGGRHRDVVRPVAPLQVSGTVVPFAFAVVAARGRRAPSRRPDGTRRRRRASGGGGAASPRGHSRRGTDAGELRVRRGAERRRVDVERHLPAVDGRRPERAPVWHSRHAVSGTLGAGARAGAAVPRARRWRRARGGRLGRGGGHGRRRSAPGMPSKTPRQPGSDDGALRSSVRASR
jgi:hypothetical protein